MKQIKYFHEIGQYSIFYIKGSKSSKKYFVFSHIADETVYGWEYNKFPKDIEELPFPIQICDIDEHTKEIDYFLYEDPHDSSFTYQIIYESQYAPKVFVSFEYKFLQRILENKIPIYHDYNEKGFGKFIKNPQFEQFFKYWDDTVGYFHDESLFIKKEDYELIKKSL